LVPEPVKGAQVQLIAATATETGSGCLPQDIGESGVVARLPFGAEQPPYGNAADEKKTEIPFHKIMLPQARQLGRGL
jgi:hypothetical protein